MAWALRTGRKPRLSFEMGYHALEIVEGARISEEGENFYTLKTKFDRPAPISSDFYGGECEERSLAEKPKI